MTRDELTARDEVLLEEARSLAEAIIDGVLDFPRDPRWGITYDPLRILRTTADPWVFRTALVNVRIAVYPEERWAKCANCLRLYLVGEHGDVVCSGECHASYVQYLNNAN